MISCLLYLCCGGLIISTSLAEVMPDGQSMTQNDDDESDTEVGMSTLHFVPKYSRLLDAKELEKIKDSPSVGTVFYYKTRSSNWTEDFLSMYDKSAGFLNAYGLLLGVVDCSGTPAENLKEQCSGVKGEFVHTYRRGKPLLKLEMMTMFDVDSIMGNILLLALVEEVAIVQTKASRLELEHDNAGQMEVVMAYHTSVGSYENRVFMEIAYAYQDKYKFAIASEHAATVGLQDAEQLVSDDPNSPDCMIWVLYCRERYSLADGCRSVNYRGRLNLIDLALFFKRLDWPRVVHKSKGSEETHPCESSKEVGCVIVSHSPAAQAEADHIIDSLQFDLHGMAGLIVEHVESETDAKVLQVILQKPGGQNVTLDGNLEQNAIENAVSTHLLPGSESETEESEQSERPPDPTDIDDMVVQMAVNRRHSIADLAHIPALTDKTFPVTTKGNQLVVVLFYLPFDAEGMVFLIHLKEAGKTLAVLKGDDPSDHPLARVNCFDWMDVCQKENITTYPTIYIYRKGGKREQYRHALDKDVVVRTVMLLQAEQPLMLTTEKEVDQFLSGRLPTEAYEDVDNLVVLKLSKSRKEMEMYTAVVKALETQMLFAIVAPDVTSLVPNGGVLHKRTKDPIQPIETMTEPQDAASIIQFLQKKQFTLFPELTFMNFPSLFARKQPFAILFYEPSVPSANDMHQTIVDLLLSEKVHDMIFCKMTVGDSNPVAKPLLLNYTQTEDVPAFTIVNHEKGQVYVLQDQEMTGSALLPWIQAVQKGEVVPTKILERGEWKAPGQHYDFLALMDKDKKRKEMEAKKKAEAEMDDEDSSDDQHDVETRSSLLELRQSRLYSGKDRKMHAPAPGKQQAPGKGSDDTVTATVESQMPADKGKDQKAPEHSEL